jgi:uncharacterized protein YbjT (DUF2867 family)
VDDEIPEGTDEVWAAYLQAKKAAEQSVRAYDDLDWTVLRPGRLTDDPGTGRVLLSAPPVERGEVPRDDVAAVLAALLDTSGTAGLTLELRAGEQDVLAAVSAASMFPR